MQRARTALSRRSFGFLLAKALQRWNAALEAQFAAAGFGYVRASFGSVLVPLLGEDGLRMRDLADRSRLSKQTMTTMVRLVESAALVERRADPEDGRSIRVYLTKTGQRFRPVAKATLTEIEREFLSTGPAAEGKIVRRWLAAYAGL